MAPLDDNKAEDKKGEDSEQIKIVQFIHSPDHNYEAYLTDGGLVFERQYRKGDRYAIGEWTEWDKKKFS